MHFDKQSVPELLTELTEEPERRKNLFAAAGQANIGIHQIDSMLRGPNCPSSLYAGTKISVKRKESEQFISQRLII